MQISIKTNFTDIQKRLDAMQDDLRTKVSVSAVNKTIEQARTQMVRQITSEYAVKAGYVRDRLRIRRASFKQGAFNVEAALVGGDGKRRSANMIAFMGRSVTFAAARRQMAAGEGGTYKLRSGGVVTKALELRFRIKRGGATKVVKGAFIGNKGRTIFIREGGSRLPIKPVQTVDVPQMFNQRRINAAVVTAINERFAGIFEREANFYTAKFNRG